MLEENLLTEKITFNENENTNNKRNNKRKSSEITYEVRLENKKAFPFYYSISTSTGQ